MQFDTLVIGGGIAGLTAAIRCCEAGLKTAIISSGQSALHFSSGSIDVLNRLPNGLPIVSPFEACTTFAHAFPNHPYAKIEAETVKNALDWFAEQVHQQGVALTHNSDESNHLRLTPLGALRGTYLSQPSTVLFQPSAANVSESNLQDNGQKQGDNEVQVANHFALGSLKQIAIANIQGYRDFQPDLLANNLQQQPGFKGATIKSITINLPTLPQPCEYRSIDVAHFLREPTNLHALADQLQRHARHADLVIMPACLGNGDGQEVIKKLRQLSGLNLCEMPTMPPSMMGLRIEEALKKQLLSLGGLLLNGDEVQQGIFDDGKLSALVTRNHDIPLKAQHFVLASGSYFSRGLQAHRKQTIEPIFGLEMATLPGEQGFHDQFLSHHPHAFMQQGVETNHALQPSIAGNAIPNLYCAGSVLAHYDPVYEGSGGGVAISTGYQIAEQIITQQKERQHSQAQPSMEVVNHG